jgi:hypothetical protein
MVTTAYKEIFGAPWTFRGFAHLADAAPPSDDKQTSFGLRAVKGILLRLNDYSLAYEVMLLGNKLVLAGHVTFDKDLSTRQALTAQH